VHSNVKATFSYSSDAMFVSDSPRLRREKAGVSADVSYKKYGNPTFVLFRSKSGK